MKKIIISISSLALALCLNAQTVTSPDGNLKVNLSLNGDGTPMYNVVYGETTVIENSPIGLNTTVGDFTKGLTLQKSSEMEKVIGEYSMDNAKVASAKWEANEQVFTYARGNNPAFDLIFHVDNNNIAFRYQVYKQRDRLSCMVNNELTAYTFPEGTTTFNCPQMTPQTGFARTAPSYETYYEYDAKMGSNGHGRGFVYPALFKVTADAPSAKPAKGKKAVEPQNIWVMVSETGVDGSYCGSRLECKSNVYTVTYPEATEFGGVGTSAPGIMLRENDKQAFNTKQYDFNHHQPGFTPWRTITVGNTLKPMAETTIMWDVVEQRFPASQNYKYGRSVWSWIIRMDASCNFDEQKEYIDFAAKLGWEYILIDALWDSNIGYDRMAELVRYAASKNVGVYLWYNSNGFWNDAPQGPRGKLHSMIERHKEMAWLKATGVKGLKIDFVGSDKQQTMQLYEDIFADANDYGLEIIFHGCTLPRGWERMYPNFVACEAVRASENLSFGQHDNDIEALAATIHPVLRNAVGNMDFGGSALNKFYSKGNNRGNHRVTDDSYALATAILFQSPVQNFALAPNNLTDAPEYCIDFMKAVPTTWRDMQFIDCYPGKYILLARQAKSGKWYVAGVNAEKEPLTVSVPVSMFAAGTEVKVYVNNEVKTMKVSKKQTIEVTIPSNGGLVIM